MIVGFALIRSWGRIVSGSNNVGMSFVWSVYGITLACLSQKVVLMLGLSFRGFVCLLSKDIQEL